MNSCFVIGCEHLLLFGKVTVPMILFFELKCMAKCSFFDVPSFYTRMSSVDQSGLSLAGVLQRSVGEAK